MRSWFASGKPGPIVISTLVVVGFLGVLVILILKPAQIDDKIADLLKILLGSLGAKFGDVVQYHIGSSAGSRNKDDIISGIAGAVPPKDA